MVGPANQGDPAVLRHDEPIATSARIHSSASNRRRRTVPGASHDPEVSDMPIPPTVSNGDPPPVGIAALARSRQALLCPIAVRCIAMLETDAASQALADLPEHRGVETAKGWAAPSAAFRLLPLWSGIERITLSPFLIRHHVARIVFLNGCAYDGMRFSGGHRIPHTVLAALPGRPMTSMIDHPLFEDLTFQANDDGSPCGPGPSVPVDGDLRGRIDAQQRRLFDLIAADCGS